MEFKRLKRFEENHMAEMASIEKGKIEYICALISEKP
jgi:hypothetical protein